MVSLRPSRRGTSTFGCLVMLALVVGGAYYGLPVGRIYLRYYELLDDMRQQARFAGQVTDDVIRGHLLAQADSILGHAPQFDIRRQPNRIIIETRYTERVDLPLLKKTFVLRPRAEEPL